MNGTNISSDINILKKLNDGNIPVIIGPTSIGKTSLSLKVAKKLDAEIISIDSRQIYKNFKIVTGQPSSKDLHLIKHHLIDKIDSTAVITAYQYLKMVESIFKKTKKRIVIVCGSLLYLNCLINGIINIPSSSKSIKKRIENDVLQRGVNKSYENLYKVDKAYASKIHINDIKKIVRAYEIIELTSTTPTEAYNKYKESFNFISDNLFLIKITSTNESIKKKIESRIVQMFHNGWVDEVESLLSNGVDINSHPMQSIGYKQIANLVIHGHHKNNKKLSSIKDSINRETWQFAKKQKTWMNNFEHDHIVELI